jgi:hypothetical protein
MDRKKMFWWGGGCKRFRRGFLRPESARRTHLAVRSHGLGDIRPLCPTTYEAFSHIIGQVLWPLVQYTDHFQSLQMVFKDSNWNVSHFILLLQHATSTTMNYISNQVSRLGKYWIIETWLHDSWIHMVFTIWGRGMHLNSCKIHNHHTPIRRIFFLTLSSELSDIQKCWFGIKINNFF